MVAIGAAPDEVREIAEARQRAIACGRLLEWRRAFALHRPRLGGAGAARAALASLGLPCCPPAAAVG